MAMKVIESTIRGTAPLLMHNGQLANPLAEATKTLKKYTSKRSKTDEDYMDVAKAEFFGSLYLNADGRVIMPADNFARMFYDAGKRFKLGTKTKEGLFVVEDALLAYEGPAEAVALWEDANFRHMATVVVNRARVSRTRPVFHEWALTFEATVDTDILNPEQYDQILAAAGAYVGLGDWRPRYGRFEVVENVIA